jgi:hypothetical protein
MYQIKEISRKIYRCWLPTTREILQRKHGRITFTCNDGHLIKEGLKEPLLKKDKLSG